MIGFRLAWAFLTRLPGGSHPADERALATAVPWFPVVGAVLGALLGVFYLGAVEVIEGPGAALLVLGLGAMVTGAFHEDGLADTFDSFGGYDQERRLAIMRDSRIGTFGALALVIATGLKVAALAQLSGADGFGVLVAAHLLGRGAALAVMWVGPEARADGLAASAANPPGRAVGAVVVLATLGAAAVGPVTAAGVGLLAIVVVTAVVSARRRFGGTTGDLLGAVEQIGEIVVMSAAAEILPTMGWLWG